MKLTLLVLLIGMALGSAKADTLQSPHLAGPVVSVGTEPLSAAETEALRHLLDDMGSGHTSKLEAFVGTYPESPWTPSVRNNLAEFYRARGLYTRALQHWEAAWKATQVYTNDAGQAVADRTLAHWSQLLASLGRTEQLQALFQQTAGRMLADVAARQLWQNSREGYDLMLRSPEVAYRCGTFALRAVGQVLERTNRFNALLNEPSPVGGFALSRLVDLAQSNRLDLVAVVRPAGTEIVVPSVVHWRQDHYAAILAREGNLCWVSDPTFSQGDWMSISTVNEEASGNFLIPAAQVPKDWRQLSRAEAGQIHGKGQPHNVKDWRDEGCDKSPGGAGAPVKGECPPCVGMPVWWVSEPYLNLFLADEPLSYPTSSGENFAFRWTYKQRDAYALSAAYYPTPALAAQRDLGMTNATWSHNWLSSIRFRDTAWDAGHPHDCVNQPTLKPTYTYYEAVVYLPGGGVRVHAKTPVGDQLTEARSKVQLVPLAGTRPTNGGGGQSLCGNTSTNGFKLVYPDGAEDHYGLSIKKFGTAQQCQFLSESEALLTRRIDAQGQQTTLCYENVPRGAPGSGLANVLRVKYLTDPDRRTNTFSYSTNFPDLVTAITDPYGRVAQFGYDGSGRLTSVIDAVGLTNTFQYRGGDGIITNLTTPYGSTGFEHNEAFQAGQGNFGGHNLINRYLRVNEPNAAKQLFLYRYDATNLVPASYATSEVPTNTPLLLDNSALNFRNSFHWGRRQYAALSTTVPTNFTAADYQLARQQHWLDSDEVETVSDRISLRREPSPDGTSAGQKTWFSYEGKDPASPFRVGTEALLGLVARVLPDGSTQYENYLYAANGLVWTTESTYTLTNGPVGLRSWLFYYEANGIDLRYVIGPGFSAQAALGHNTNHQITFLTNALGHVTKFDYDAVTRQPTSATLANGQTATLTYYSSNAASANGGFLQTIQWNPGPTWSFGYDKGLVKYATNDLGLWLAFTWDDLLRPTSTSFPDGSYTSNRYAKLDLVATRDRMGNWTYAGYDALQHPIAITNANNAVTRLDWCGCGALNSITDALTNLTLFYYDNQGRQTNVVFADGSSRKYFYDLAGRTTNVLDGNRSLKLAYNNQGLLTTVSNAYGLLERVVYNAVDLPQAITDANNVTVTNTFDLLNRLTARVWPDGFGETYGWSTNGLIAHTNRNGQVTRYFRDAGGRLLAVTNANSEVTRVLLNSLGQVTDLWDGLNHQTQFGYDEYGRRRTRTDGLGRTTSWDYNPNGWLTNRATPQFGNTTYRYDPVGNLTNIVYPSSSLAYAFDALNRLTNMSDAIGATKFTHTAIGQLKTEDGPWSDDTVTLTYTEGLRTAMSIGSSWSQTYGYDSAWRMTGVSSPAGSFGYTYDASRIMQLVGITLPNFATITNHYDTLGRLDQTALLNRWGHTLDGYTYTHDPISLRTNLTRDFGLTTNSVNIGYDSIGQLTRWSAKETGGALRHNEQLAWNFDAAGNLNRRTNGWLTQTFTVDTVNELTNIIRTGPLTVTGNTPAPATNITVNGSVADRYGDFTFARTNNTLSGTTNTFTNIAQNVYGLSKTNTSISYLPTPISLSYDLNGNLTNDGLRNFSYDAENQLVTNWITGQWKTEFVYDGFGRRRITRDYTWNSGLGTWTKTNEVRHLYDGLLPVQERDTSNNPLVTYTRGLDLSGSIHGAGGIGGLLARTDVNGSAFYHSDGSGNITALIDSNGDIAARYLYNPFGKLIGKWGTLADANTMRFSSKEHHANSGLYYYGFRFYDPSLQRWLNEDLMGEAGGINLYGFVGNSPLNAVDPDGRFFGYLYSGMSSVYEGIADSTSSSLVGGLASFASGMAQQIASLDPVRNGFHNMQTLKEQGLPTLLENAYAGLQEGVGTADFVRARDYEDEYNALEQGIYGAAGLGKSFLCVVGGVRAVPAARTTPEIVWPANRGFMAGEGGQATVLPGQVLDRFGGNGGSFLSPAGTPAAARSLAPGTELRPLNSFDVLRPFDAGAGRAAPWFNQPGGGLQFDLGTRTVQDLIDAGVLRLRP